MKKLLLSAAAAVGAFASPALAADLAPAPYTKAPVHSPPATIYNWTGFYIGGHLGGVFTDGNNLLGNDARFMGGVQGGFDYQFSSNFVGGIEAEYSWLNSNNTGVQFPGGSVITGRNNEIGSVTGRAGYTWGPGLLYAKGGYAWRDNPDLGVSVAGTPVPFTATGAQQSGWTVGAGLEYMFAPNWSAKAEYQYYNFGTTTFTSGPAEIVGSRFRDDEHSVKVGVNYRFGWGGPIGAKY